LPHDDVDVGTIVGFGEFYLDVEDDGVVTHAIAIATATASAIATAITSTHPTSSPATAHTTNTTIR
jgi:hypothetical protein